MDSPTPKRPRIMAPGSGTNDADRFIDHLGTKISMNKIFKTLGHYSQFQIKDLPTDPEALLAGVFQYCIDSAIDKAKENNMEADQLGCTISSELLHPDVYLPIRPITENTCSAILNFFLEVAQSKAQEGINLWGKPFTVNVCTVSVKSLPTSKRIVGGAPRKRELAPVRHHYAEQYLIKIRNRYDRFCLFYALQATFVHNVKNLPRKTFQRYLHSEYGQRGLLRRDTEQLMRAVGAPMDLPEYDARIYVPRVVDYWHNLYNGQHKIKVFIFGTMGHYKPMYKYGAEEYKVPILLLHYNHKHFDGVQSTSNLFGQPYCLACEQTYHEKGDHSMNCKDHCLNCSDVGPEFPCKAKDGFFKKCQDCNKRFYNEDCYKHHLSSNYCRKSKFCEECGIIYNARRQRELGVQHICGHRYCAKCYYYHNPKDNCYIQPLEAKVDKNCRFIAFDLETMFHKAIDPMEPKKKFIHEPNFIAAQVTCQECIKSGAWKHSLKDNVESLINGEEGCKVCGPNRTITFSHSDYVGTEVDEKRITRHPAKEFVNWILNDLPDNYETYAFSHNGGRFDMVIIFKELFMERILPELITKGNKLYVMKVERQANDKGTIFFKDSYNLLNEPLGALPAMFDLDVQDKPFFPYLANRPENYNKEIYPTKSDYLAEGMMPEKRKKFDIWFEQHKLEPFHLSNQLASYCLNDVFILMAALIKFRHEFMAKTARPKENGTVDRPASKVPHKGLDPLIHSLTIASACIKHFKMNHLKKGHLALVPERGYDNVQNQSPMALKFMKWYAEINNITIRTAHSAGGEKKVGPYSLDGWIEEEQRAIEFHGCCWHGCKKCYPDDNFMLPNKMTAGMTREKNNYRMEYLQRRIPHIDVFWSCDVERMLDLDPDMKKKFDEYLDDGPIDIRSCFYGGRTGPMKLHYKVKPGQKISYYDVSSLYPYVNFMLEPWMIGYPIGHPKVHVLNQDVEWNRPAHNPFPLAILKVFAVPPRSCDIPVLPMKLPKDNRLLFPLCAKCAKQYPEGGVNEHYKCQHSRMERGWVSTCTSIELNEALKEGYQVLRVYRVLEYKEADKELFRSYMREFIAEKIHSSGFGDGMLENPEARQQFIDECLALFGIKIDPSKMKPNKALRQLSKLFVNNLWGRLSLRNHGLAQTTVTDDPSALGDYLRKQDTDVSSLDELTPEVMMLTYQKKKEWTTEHDSSNVVISLFTTSYARILLLKAMQQVARSPGCELLYTDTDSLIYVHPIESNPIDIGRHIGQFTDEFPKHIIVEAVFGGSKQYGLQLKRIGSADGEFEYILKLRGMTLNYDVINNQGLRYDTFKEKVLKYGTTGELIPIQILYPYFLRPNIKKGHVTSEARHKIYKPFVGKGIVRPSDLSVLPFGFFPSDPIRYAL